MARYMLILRYDEAVAMATPPDPAVFEEMGRFNTAMVDAGVLLAGEGLAPSSQGAVVTFPDGGGDGPTVSDGPFTEARELIHSGAYDLCFFMGPTPVERIAEVAEAGESMPPKSTYFFPKILTGLLFNPLVDG